MLLTGHFQKFLVFPVDQTNCFKTSGQHSAKQSVEILKSIVVAELFVFPIIKHSSFLVTL